MAVCKRDPSMCATSGDAATLNEKISALLGDRKGLKAQVQSFWDAVDTKTEYGLDVEGLKALCEDVERAFGMPVGAFGKLEDTHKRFDFNGDGTLQFKEVYRCVKRAMADFLKTNGGRHESDLRHMAPEEAGFTKVRILGHGAQGQACLVTNVKGEELLLKTYPRDNDNFGGLMDLIDEAAGMQLLADCDHIAKCLDIFQDDHNFYMVSVVNRGGDWTTVQTRAKYSDVMMSEYWYHCLFEQAFEGLAHLHRNAVMHCDIKEANLMVKEADYANPKVVLIDLGLCKAYFPHDTNLSGTPGYIPPETWATSKWFPRGDVFSMGVVCVQMLTGMVPNGSWQQGVFCNGCLSMQDVMRATSTRQPPLHRAIPQSPELLAWLGSCLEKDFTRRPRAPQVLAMPWFSSPLPSQRKVPPNQIPEKKEPFGFFGFACCAGKE